MKCGVCYEYFDLQTRRPKIIPCGHTFCFACLQAILSTLRTQCPTCRKEYTVHPAELPDNFIALDESVDVQSVLNMLWCPECCDVPRVTCLETHVVAPARLTLKKEEEALDAALTREQDVCLREAELVDKMGAAFDDLVRSLRESAAERLHQLQQLRRTGGQVATCTATSPGPAIKAIQDEARKSKARATDMLRTMSLANASQALLRVECDQEWVSYSAGGKQDGEQDELSRPRAPSSPDEAAAAAAAATKDRSLFYLAFALSAQPGGVPRLQRSGGLLVHAAVRSQRAGPQLPDVTLELSDVPSATTLRELAVQGWRRYGICRWCLESCHVEGFTPRPIDPSGSAPVERGAVCLGRGTGRYYIILCSDMQSRFLLDLSATFKVVGRVSANLDSLERALHRSTSRDLIYIEPQPDTLA